MKQGNKRPLKDINNIEKPMSMEKKRKMIEDQVCRTSCGSFVTSPMKSPDNVSGKLKKKKKSKKSIQNPSPGLIQTSINKYFRSPSFSSSNNTSLKQGERTSAVDVTSPTSSMTYECKKDIMYKVNKLFTDDLRFPRLSPFSPLSFSCSSLSDCKHVNHQACIKELNRDDERTLMFLANERCWYLLILPLRCHITERTYLSPLLFRSLFYGISTEFDENICLNLVKMLKTHLHLHPPCRKDLRNFYRSVLVGNIKVEDHINPHTVKYDFQTIINDIEKTCKLVSSDKKPDLVQHHQEKKDIHEDIYDGNPSFYDVLSHLSTNYVENDNILSLPEFNYQETEPQNRENIDSEILLQRLFHVFDVTLDILEENFRIWRMKSRYMAKEKLNSPKSQPYIAAVGWKNNQRKGCINEHCVKVFMLFTSCPHKYKHYLARYITLLFQIAQINEDNEEMKFPFYHNLSNAFASELCEHIKGRGEPDENSLSMIRYVHPTWLRFKICGILLKSELTSDGRDDLRSARMVLRSWLSTERDKANHRDSAGETIIHKYCKAGINPNSLNSLKTYLKNPHTNVNIQDNAGWTPLHNASVHNSVECIRLLIKYRLPPVKGAEELNLFSLNNDMNSPLMCAVEAHNEEVVDILLENGVGCTVWNKNSEGQSAIDLAPSNLLKEKLISSWKQSIATYEVLNMKSLEIEVLNLMIAAYCSTYHVKERIDQSDLKSFKQDAVYKYNYAQYLKDEITFERLLSLVNKLSHVPSNPKNLNDLLQFLNFC